MKTPFGLDKKCIADLQSVFRRYPRIERVLVFGSRAIGNYRPGSDIDFALFGENLGFDDVVSIQTDFDQLPYAYQYDVIVYDQITNPAVKAHIDDFGLTFYEKKELSENAQNWMESKLSEIAKIVMGQSPESSTCNEKGDGTPLLNGPTEFGGYYPIPVQFTTDPKKFAQKNDLLFCVRGSTTGRMNWADQTYAVGRGIAALHHKEGSEYQPFLRGLIEHNLPLLLSHATGSTFPNVSKQQIEDLEVFVPLLPTQRRIAAILSALDDKIELNRRMNRTLEGMAQAIFREWFVRFNFPGATGETVETELGEVPKGWRVGTIGDLLNHSKESISPGGFGEKEFWHYSLPAFDQGKEPMKEKGNTILSNKYVVRSNSILVSKLNPRIPRIWAIEQIDESISICSTEFQVFLPKKGFYYSFSNVLFSQNPILETMKGRASGTSSSHQRINPSDILNLEIIIPEDSLLKKYEKTVRGALKFMLANTQQSNTLTQLRGSLLPKLMRGELLNN